MVTQNELLGAASCKGKLSLAANHSPNAPRLRKATQTVFAPGPPFSRRQSGAGLPLAPWALLLLGRGLQHPKPIPQGFSLAGKQDWAREGLLRPGLSHAP